MKPRLAAADMPWLSYHLGPRQAVRNAARFVRDAGADAVKIEGGRKRVDVLRALADAEIPVMGHIGLTPQSVLPMGGFRVQGRTPEEASRLLEDAQAIVDAGVFALVLEGIPPDLAARVTGCRTRRRRDRCSRHRCGEGGASAPRTIRVRSRDA